jgi:hypothetical protein
VARVRKEIKTMLEKESMGFVVRSRYKESIESEKASVFHLNRENKNYKKNSLKSLKINGEVTTDESKIEAEVLKYLGALLNGHHDRNGEDTGQPFVPDYTELPDFLSNLTKLSQESQDSLIKILLLIKSSLWFSRNVRGTKALALMDFLTNSTRSPGKLLERILSRSYNASWTE